MYVVQTCYNQYLITHQKADDYTLLWRDQYQWHPSENATVYRAWEKVMSSRFFDTLGVCQRKAALRATEDNIKLSNGWRLRTGGFAKLCGTCYSVYKDGKFCEKFHSNEDGWRECEDCTRPIHCGCIVSLKDYSFDDFRGIICLKCIWAGFKLEPSHFNTELDPLDITDLVKYYDIQPEDLVQPSTNRVPDTVLVLLFEKVLTAHDARREQSYIIIPNKHAKAHFSEAFKRDRFPITILDTDGNNWDFYFRRWVNTGNKKKFVLKGISDFIITKDLVAGDTVAFYRRESDGKIILEIRKPCVEIPTDHQDGRSTSLCSHGQPMQHIGERLILNLEQQCLA
nr:hypothetical protein [Tanacetum cinerariifolium]